MKINAAMLCMDCEEIFQGSQCPTCGRDSFAPLANWVRPLRTAIDSIGQSRFKKLYQAEHDVWLESLR